MSFPSKVSGFSVGGGVRGVRLVVRWLVAVVVLVSDVSVPLAVDESSGLVINQMPSAPRTNTITAPAAASGIHGTLDPPDGGC
jgi:hypothetical protein